MGHKTRKLFHSSSQLDLFEALQEQRPANAPDTAQLNNKRLAQQDALSTRDVIGARKPVVGTSRSQGRPPQLPAIVDEDGFATRRLLNVDEAAALLGLSKSTLDKMRCYGNGPRFINATCRAVRYDPADLQAFIASRRRSKTSVGRRETVRDGHH